MASAANLVRLIEHGKKERNKKNKQTNQEKKTLPFIQPPSSSNSFNPNDFFHTSKHDGK
jgi:hypothetical protein